MRAGVHELGFAATMPYLATTMLPQKFDTTLALKAIGLSDKLNGTEKRVATVLLDHFNRQTGRCDPSQDTIATLLQMHRRTVVRAIKKVVKVGLFRMVRHGGNNHCNSYQPCWVFFRAAEERWKGQRREHADRFAHPSLSPSGGQTCRTGDDDNVSQTCSNNIIPLTSSRQLSANAQLKSSVSPGVDSADGLGIFGKRIEEKLGKEVFGAWFQNVHFVEETGGRIILSAVTRHAKSYIEQQFEPKVLECFHPEYPDAVRIEVILRRPLT
jgi:hypothetical protein